jgi:hypothetical protein
MDLGQGRGHDRIVPSGMNVWGNKMLTKKTWKCSKAPKVLGTEALISIPAMALGLIFSLAMGVPLSLAQEAQNRDKQNIKVLSSEIRVINNPREPEFASLILDLQEEINIGRDDDKNYLFWLIHDIQVDDEGRIYVDDARNFRIQVFDRNGKYLKTIGRQGQGPGEFQQPTKLRVHPRANQLYVRDTPSRRISIFNLIGNYLGSVPTQQSVLDYFPLETSELVAALSLSSASDLTDTHFLAKIDTKGTILKESTRFLSNFWQERTSGGTTWASTGYEFQLYIAPLGKDTFVSGFSNEYGLTVVDKDLKALCQINKVEPTPTLTGEERKLFERFPTLKTKPYYFAILSDSRGRIYVQRNFTHNKNTVQDDIPKNVDVFGNDGIFIYRTSLPPNTRVIRDGYLYSFSVDWEGGLESVHRYRIKNWGQIKERSDTARN